MCACLLASWLDSWLADLKVTRVECARMNAFKSESLLLDILSGSVNSHIYTLKHESFFNPLFQAIKFYTHHSLYRNMTMTNYARIYF